MLSDALIDLASYADIRGIDWQALNAAGQGVLQSEAYVDVLEARWQGFYAVAQTLAITDAEWEETSAESAREAWVEVRDALNERAGLLLEAISQGEVSLAYDHAVQLWSGSLKKLVVATSHVSHRNLTAHEDGTLAWALEAGETTVADVEQEASAIAMLWDAIIKLDGWGALQDLKKPEYGGVGQAQQTLSTVLARGLPILIVAVAVAAVVTAIVVWLSYLSDRNDKIDRFCFDGDKLREDRPPWCDEPGQGMRDPLSVFLKPFEEAGKQLATGLTVIGGILAVVWVGSLIVPRLAERVARKVAG